MNKTPIARRIEDLIAPQAESLGFSLVRVLLFGQQRPRLQVMAERVDGRPMLVDDCATLSRAISAVLDVADPIAGAYTLEVSSPGIDRPLTRLADFDRFAGFEAKLELDAPVEGRKRFTGRILGTEADRVRVAVAGNEVALPFDHVIRAKLLLTDELLAATSQDQGAATAEETNR